MIKRTASIFAIAGWLAFLGGATVLPFPALHPCCAQTAQPTANQPAKLKISFQGGPGDTPRTAVVIAGAANSMEGVKAEYHYLKKKYGAQKVAWKLKRQSVLRQQGKIYDRLEIELKDGSQKTVFFDISEFFGKL